jgi:hypothetical protein
MWFRINSWEFSILAMKLGTETRQFKSDELADDVKAII